MKEFEVQADGCKGLNLEGSSLFILKAAIFERALDESKGKRLTLVSPLLEAHKKSIDFEKKLLELDRRLKRGFELLVQSGVVV